MLSAFLALHKLSSGLLNLAGALIAWQQIERLAHAAARPQQLGLADAAAMEPQQAEVPVLQAHALAYGYPNRNQTVLEACSINIYAGQRLLLEGPSGGGKSTLTALLLGLRQQDAGLLLVGGLDRQTLGDEGWQRRVAAAPQFHENHLLTESFAFNLLMGRRWPPTRDDLQTAYELCIELGLEPLLTRMPGGLFQMVGETGWQLSHGEKSRLYIARALLQQGDVLILDEGFAALDPENLRQVVACVQKRAPALLAIAHP